MRRRARPPTIADVPAASAPPSSSAAQPFSVMWISFAFQSDRTNFGAQYSTSGPNTSQDECIFGCDLLIGTSR